MSQENTWEANESEPNYMRKKYELLRVTWRDFHPIVASGYLAFKVFSNPLIYNKTWWLLLPCVFKALTSNISKPSQLSFINS